jgi:hypothetical protein
MIWGHTPPVARLIEGAICEGETVERDEYRDVAILHALALPSTILDFDFARRVVEERAVKPRSVPTALHVYQESRNLTLRNYQFMTHSASTKALFYFNACRCYRV